MQHRRCLQFLLACALGACLLAQVGFPSAQYPSPGRVPNPGPGGAQIPRAGKRPGATPQQTATIHESGTIEKVAAQSLTITSPDHRNIRFDYSARTNFLSGGQKISASDLKPGDEVCIEATQDEQGLYHALQVTLESRARDTGSGQSGKRGGGSEADKPSPPAEQKSEAGQVAQPTAGQQPPAEQQGGELAPSNVERIDATAQGKPPAEIEDSGPPTLRRGKPESAAATKKQPSATKVPAATAASAAPALPASSATAGRETGAGQPAVPQPAGARPAAPQPPAPPLDPRAAFIERTRERTAEYTEKMPNFVCQQVTTRYFSADSGRRWDAQDVVSANVVYEEGKESYHNIAVNGKPANKSMEELGGSWSTGEFATLLANLLAPATDAQFRYRQDSTAAGLPAAVYDFDVEQRNSNWDVSVTSQSIAPAYRGSVWIDKQSAKVLRIEMQARGMPAGFPLDTVETTLDYALVRLGTQDFLLPARSENLACWRGTSHCSRNTIDFRNYRKYTADSKIIFDK